MVLIGRGARNTDKQPPFAGVVNSFAKAEGDSLNFWNKGDDEKDGPHDWIKLVFKKSCTSKIN